jgi:hypothetical protein
LSTKLLSTKLTSVPLTKRRACVVPLKHGANRDQSKTEGNRYHVDEFRQSYSQCNIKQWSTPGSSLAHLGSPIKTFPYFKFCATSV